ncbi:hypothetical protein AB1K91_11855 [Terribacillus sp. 179-K 1B1 HS]|uniref:hypothetical protein n=1 Tax=Terribacillus sp. 179-K 1B1 HS TaxID=3142388 RepID=UPI0039A1F4E0
MLIDTIQQLNQDDIGVFMIAHRLSTLKVSDQIIVLEDGDITGIGNHDDLYASNEHYRNSHDRHKQKE